METALRKYVESCEKIFEGHLSKLSHIIRLPGTVRSMEETIPFFHKAVEEAESLPAFDDVVWKIGSGVLSKDLEKLSSQEQKRAKRPLGSQRGSTVTEWREATARNAAHRVFVNTGTYLQLWLGTHVNLPDLVEILCQKEEVRASDYIRLFVFDGFVLCGGGVKLNCIKLPIGELKVFNEPELEKLLRLPQSKWHDDVSKDMPEDLAHCHVLAVAAHEPYRGRVGIWSGGHQVSRIRLADISDVVEDDVYLYGPLFICLADKANLAEEIRVRTNIFDGAPVSRRERNGYLPWSQIDEEGNEHPPSRLVELGKDGEKLKKIYEAWRAVDRLRNGDGFLVPATYTFSRSIMSLKRSTATDSRLKEVFVGLVSVIESILNPDSQSELAHKTALRGAALLAYLPQERLMAFKILSHFYRVRSKIVHEGNPGKIGLDELIDLGLLEMSREILLRYIFILDSAARAELEAWVLPTPTDLNSNGRRFGAINEILNATVMDPSITKNLERMLNTHNLLEPQNWKHSYISDILLAGLGKGG